MKTKGKLETLYFIMLLGLSKFVTYFVLLVLANLFLLPDYGRASFVISAYRVAILIGSVGLPFVYVPWIINKKDTSSVFYFLLFLSIAMLLGGLVIGLQHPWTLPIVFAVPLTIMSGVSNAILRVKHQYHSIQIQGMLLELYALVALILLAGYGKSGIIWGHAISIYITNLAFFYLTRKELWEIMRVFKFNLKVVWEYLRKGTITSLLYLSMVFLNWIDSLVLGVLSTFENVAKYNVAGPISNVLSVLPFALSMFLLTRESEVKNKKRSKAILRRGLRLSFSFSLLIAIVMISLIFPLIKIFFPKYIGVEIYVMILSMGILFYSVYALLYIYETGKLQPEKAFWPLFLAAVINFTLDVLLIPTYGLYGITFATTVAHGFAFTALSYKMGLLKEFLPVYPMLLFLPLSYYLGILGLLLIPVAFGALYLFRLLKEGDLWVIIKTGFDIFERFR